MIISEVIVERHHGCLFSDVTEKFPQITLFSCLEAYDEAYYKVNTILYREKELADSEELGGFLGEIAKHPLFEDMDVLHHPLFSSPLFSIKVHDFGYTEGVVRIVMRCKDVELPQFQKFTASQGQEKYYVVSYTNVARDTLEKTLKLRIGEHLVQIRDLKKDALGTDILDYVPSYFSIFIPKELNDLLLDIMKDFYSGKWQTTTETKLDSLAEKIANPKYLWVLKWFLRILRDYFKVPLPEFDC